MKVKSGHLWVVAAALAMAMLSALGVFAADIAASFSVVLTAVDGDTVSSVLLAAGPIALDAEVVERELKRISGEVKDFTKSVHAEVNARLANVEQHLAMGQRGRGGVGQPAAGGIAHLLLNPQGDDGDGEWAGPQLSGLRQWNNCSARLRARASIKAALVNIDNAGSDDTTFPSQPELGGLVGPVLRPLRLLDVLPHRPVDTDSVEFVRLNVSGSVSEQIKEGDEKPEVHFAGAAEHAAIVTVAGHTTASRQVLRDRANLERVITVTMRHQTLSRLEHQIINGPGGQGKIDGLLNQGTVFVPLYASSAADLIGESMTKQAELGYSPGLVVLNPNDWFRIQILKSGDGDYIFGSPKMPVPPALWNARIVTTPSMPEGTGLTVDTLFVNVLDREEASVLLSNSHKDYFTRNLVAILAELRAGLEVLDARAVFQVDLPTT